MASRIALGVVLLVLVWKEDYSETSLDFASQRKQDTVFVALRGTSEYICPERICRHKFQRSMCT